MEETKRWRRDKKKELELTSSLGELKIPTEIASELWVVWFV